MDWNKTKTIFIIVFSILNVFLYSLYVDRHTEAENVQLMGETSIEESMKSDNITFGELPVYNEEYSYVSADIATFTEADLEMFENQKFVIMDETHLTSSLTEDYSIRDSKNEYQFKQFLASHVLKGKEYVLWEIDTEKKQAVFFQKVNDQPIFFNQNAMLTVYWDEDENITGYEQLMLGEFVNFNKKKDLLSPKNAINTLYSRDFLKQNSKVQEISLGYSTLLQLTQTQVFAPTWRVRVELADGEIEDYFINASEGKIIEFPNELDEEEEENE